MPRKVYQEVNILNKAFHCTEENNVISSTHLLLVRSLMFLRYFFTFIFLCTAQVCCATKSKDITLVLFTDTTLKEIGFPVMRYRYAEVIDAIYKSYKPSVVACDFHIDLPSKDLPHFDERLFTSVKGKKNLFFPAWESSDGSGPANVDPVFLRNVFAEMVPVATDRPLWFPLQKLMENGAGMYFAGQFYDYDIGLQDRGRHAISTYPIGMTAYGYSFPSMPVVLAAKHKNISYDQVLKSHKKKYPQFPFFAIDHTKQFQEIEVLDLIIPGRNSPSGSLMDGKVVIIASIATGFSGQKLADGDRFMFDAYIRACATQTLLESLE